MDSDIFNMNLLSGSVYNITCTMQNDIDVYSIIDCREYYRYCHHYRQEYNRQQNDGVNIRLSVNVDVAKFNAKSCRIAYTCTCKFWETKIKLKPFFFTKLLKIRIIYSNIHKSGFPVTIKFLKKVLILLILLKFFKNG